MPKLDEAKERLGLLKFWLSIFVAIFVGLVGWIATHYKSFDDAFIFYGACICAVTMLILIFFANKQSKNILKEIRNLKK